MNLQTVNKYVSLKIDRNKDNEQASAVYVPESAFVDDPILSAEVVSAPTDGNLNLEPGMRVLLYSHLIEGIVHEEEKYEIAPESAIVGFFV